MSEGATLIMVQIVIVLMVGGLGWVVGFAQGQVSGGRIARAELKRGFPSFSEQVRKDLTDGSWSSAVLPSRPAYTYTIAADHKSITCNVCGRTSYNGNDVVHHYCAHCQVFHDEHQQGSKS